MSVLSTRISDILLLKESYRRDQYEFFPPSLEIQNSPPSPIGRLILYLIIFFIVIVITWSFASRIDVVSTVSGRVIPDGRIKTIQSQTDGTVKSVDISEGQAVEAGQGLITLESDVADSDEKSIGARVSFLKAQKSRLRAEIAGGQAVYLDTNASPEIIAMNESIRLARASSLSSRLAEAASLSESKRQLYRAALENLVRAENSFKAAKEKESSVRPHIGTVMTRFDYLNLKATVDQSQSDVEVQTKYVEDARQQLNAAVQKSDQIRNDEVNKINSELNDTTTQLASLAALTEKTRRSTTERVIRSPIHGTLQNLSVTTVGGYLNAGKVVATVVPTDAKLIIEANLTNEDVGFVSQGQRVNVKIDTYPSQIYGDISGIVQRVSADSESNQSSSTSSHQNGADGISNTSFAYKVFIVLEKDNMVINGRIARIIPGMTVQADIITDNRRVADFFLQPVKKAVENGLRKR